MGPWLFGVGNQSILPAQRWGDKKSAEETLGDWLKSDRLKSCQEHLKIYFSEIVHNVQNTQKKVSEGKKPVSELINFFRFGQRI